MFSSPLLRTKKGLQLSFFCASFLLRRSCTSMSGARCWVLLFCQVNTGHGGCHFNATIFFLSLLREGTTSILHFIAAKGEKKRKVGLRSLCTAPLCVKVKRRSHCRAAAAAAAAAAAPGARMKQEVEVEDSNNNNKKSCTKKSHSGALTSVFAVVCRRRSASKVIGDSRDRAAKQARLHGG